MNDIKWTGDDPAARVSVADYIADSATCWTDEELSKAESFIRGDQWNQEIHRQRMLDDRPTLTINRVHSIAASCRSVSQQRGEQVSQYEGDRLAVAIFRNNADAQRLYNYMASVAAEAESLKVNA